MQSSPTPELREELLVELQVFTALFEYLKFSIPVAGADAHPLVAYSSLLLSTVRCTLIQWLDPDIITQVGRRIKKNERKREEQKNEKEKGENDAAEMKEEANKTSKACVGI